MLQLPVSIFRAGPEEAGLLRVVAYCVFLSAFVPLIFGGKIYNAVERVMDDVPGVSTKGIHLVVAGALVYVAGVFAFCRPQIREVRRLFA